MYFLFKYINSNIDSEGNEISIEDNITECIGDTNSYFSVLSLLGKMEQDKGSKKIKIKNYYIKIKYLDPIIFKKRIISFLQFKSLVYEQYKINFPVIENYNLEDYGSVPQYI